MLRQFASKIILIVTCLTLNAWAFGQVDESDAIRQLEAVGGRVTKISADSEDREVSLYLAGKSVTDEQVALLTSVDNVKWLNLANTSVTDQGLTALAEMKLTRLHLEKTGITDKGLAHLKSQSELEYLNLYATQVTNEGLKHLTGLAKLRKLYVWQSGVNQEGIDWLQAELPELEIVGAVKLDAQPAEPKAAETEAKKDETKPDK